MKIIYAGTPEFAVPALQALLDSEHQVVAVYTQPDRPAGRGRKLSASPIKKLAQQHDLPVLQPVTLRQAQAQAELQEFGADLMVVAAYGLILPREVLTTPTHGCLNIHGSLLPRWRGAAPIQRAIIAGDKKTGVTIMQMAEGLDTGDMLIKSEIPLSDTNTASEIHDQLAELGADALMKTLDLLELGELEPEMQDDVDATYANKLSKSEAKLDWSQSAQHIMRLVNAFNAWPVAHTTVDNKVLRIWRASADQESEQAPVGTVISESAERGVQVVCGVGSLWLQEVQLPGKRPILIRDFLNGRSLLGEILG